MKRYLYTILLACFAVTVRAADAIPGWYILEKGATVGILKPGINDLIYQLHMNNNPPVDKPLIDSVNKRLEFAAGYPVLVYAKTGEGFMATDVEGRTLVIKGNMTPAINNAGCGNGYIKKDIKIDDNTTLKAGAFVWIKETKADKLEIQMAGNKTYAADAKGLYIINDITAESIPTMQFKPVK